MSRSILEAVTFVFWVNILNPIPHVHQSMFEKIIAIKLRQKKTRKCVKTERKRTQNQINNTARMFF